MCKEDREREGTLRGCVRSGFRFGREIKDFSFLYFCQKMPPFLVGYDPWYILHLHCFESKSWIFIKKGPFLSRPGEIVVP